MALEGTLQDMSLSDLFQVFRMGPKTGVLFLAYHNLRAIVYVAAGDLIDAAVVRLPDRTIIAAQDEAVIHVLLWDDATFVFRHNASVMRRPVRMRHDAEHLVLESIKRRDDPRFLLPYHHITPDTPLQLSSLTPGRESKVSLSVCQWRILSQVPHCSRIRTISEALGLPLDQVTRTCLELMAIGLIEVAPARHHERRSSHWRDQSVIETDEREGAWHAAALARANAASDSGARPLPVRRSLIDAVMRRVRGL